MKAKDWNEGLNNLDTDLIEEFVAQQDAYAQKKTSHRPRWISNVAAVLVLAMCFVLLLGQRTTSNQLLAAPVYPEMVKFVNYKDYQQDFDAYWDARRIYSLNQLEQYNQPEGYADSLTDFFRTSIPLFLQGEGNPV